MPILTASPRLERIAPTAELAEFVGGLTVEEKDHGFRWLRPCAFRSPNSDPPVVMVNKHRVAAELFDERVGERAIFGAVEETTPLLACPDLGGEDAALLRLQLRPSLTPPPRTARGA